MTPDDVARYRPLVGCAFSEDGRHVAVTVPRWEPSVDARPLSLMVRAVDDDAPWTDFTPGGAGTCYAPAFAPDGRLAFFHAADGEARVLTVDPARPDLAPTAYASPPGHPAALKWRGRPGILGCVGDDPEGWRRVYAWDVPDSPPTARTPAGEPVADFAWRPDGETLAWLGLPAAGDPAAERLPIHVGPPEGPGVQLRVPGRPIGYLGWSPDGRWLAVLSRQVGRRLSRARLWVIDPARWPREADAARCLTRELEGRITGYDWLAGSDALVVAVDQGCHGRLLRVDLGGQALPMGPRRSYLSAPHADRAAGRFVHLAQDLASPQRLMLRDADASHARELSAFHEALPLDALAAGETLSWTAADGLQLDGVVLRPPGAQGPSPLLVWLHGGPAESIGRTFSPYFQAFAGAGYAVFAPNFRGSSGRDDAFLRATVADLGGADADDVLSGVDRLVQMGVADPDRTAFVGWSYGGTLALHIAARSGIPRALAVGAPVVDWVSFFGAPRLPALYGDYFPTPLWVDRAPYDAASPISKVADVDVPTLVLHGALDGVVPPSQSRLLYRALKARGVDTDLMIYPGEGHVLVRPSAVRDMLERIIRWLAQHV